MNKLATALLALGFIPVLGTVETGSHGRKSKVNLGAPKRLDCNNGVVVVYDENGAPWIVSMASVSIPQMRKLVAEHRLGDGAYVPHSNDGGAFLRGHVPSVSTTS